MPVSVCYCSFCCCFCFLFSVGVNDASALYNVLSSQQQCDMPCQSHWKINNAPPELNLCNIHFGRCASFLRELLSEIVLHSILQIQIQLNSNIGTRHRQLVAKTTTTTTNRWKGCSLRKLFSVGCCTIRVCVSLRTVYVYFMTVFLDGCE